jgi:hypothetical protein
MDNSIGENEKIVLQNTKEKSEITTFSGNLPSIARSVKPTQYIVPNLF